MQLLCHSYCCYKLTSERCFLVGLLSLDSDSSCIPLLIPCILHYYIKLVRVQICLLPPLCHQEWHTAIGGCESFPLQIFHLSILYLHSIMHLRALDSMGRYGEVAWKLCRIHSGIGFHCHMVRFAALRLDLGFIVDMGCL